MEVGFIDGTSKFSEYVVIVVDDGLRLGEEAHAIEKLAELSIEKVLKASGYKGKFGEVLCIPTATHKIKTIVVISTGKSKEFNETQAIKLGAQLYSLLQSKKAQSAKLFYASDDDLLLQIMLGVLIKSYKFDKYITKKREGEDEVKFEKLEVVSHNSNQRNLEFEKVKAIHEGILLTKMLALEPANIMNPIKFSEMCMELEQVGVAVEVLDEVQMANLGMGAILGVAQGSVNKPRLVVMQWQGGKASDKPIALVGKGVTFDTGGLSLKGAEAMIGMKYDKTGAAVVTGVMKMLALRKAGVNVVGLIGLVENMPDGNAQRPEDIVVSMSGQTIEVLNTDAEGRLLLADVLWYAQDRFKPTCMIDLATLTGAIRIALGSEYAGLFSNDKTLASRLYETGIKTGEKVWELPLSKEYDKMMDSKVADIKNISNDGGGAGSITAAQFLQKFVNNTPWAHLDIAAVSKSDKSTEHQTSATAFGVRLLNQFMVDFYE